MKLASMMRPFVLLPQNQEHAVDDAKRTGRVREMRVGVARKHWEELPFERLVSHGRYLVDGDDVYTLFRGVTFESGSARLIADCQPHLAFYIDSDGAPVVLERVPGSWSARAARRGGRA